MGVNKKKLVLSHGGVKIYYSWKGPRALTYWYALKPNYDAEGGEDLDFDIRKLPGRYLEGLAIEEPIRDVESFERLFETHKEALRRAIDGGHDFLASSPRGRTWSPPENPKGLAGLFWSLMDRVGRLERRVRR